MKKLFSISPIDGRYYDKTLPLCEYFSESALMRYRVFVEGSYLLFLSDTIGVGPRKFTDEEIETIKYICELPIEDALLIRQIEQKGLGSIPATRHDVKAVEYFLKAKLNETSLKDVIEWIHFGITSADVNNISYALMISEAINNVLLPKLHELHEILNEQAQKDKEVSMLARTHGQAATPTTAGKEWKVYANRLMKQIAQLETKRISVKFSGATGGHAAQHAAYPNVDWVIFSKKFVDYINREKRTKLVLNEVTTQVEPGDSLAEVFDIFRRINTILIDLSQDMWRYISDSWVSQKIEDGQVGSSTMPHKINPIDFENAEGNFGIANALLEFFSRKLPVSRLQRDLSCSTVKRNFGVVFGHCLIGYCSLINGLGKISLNTKKITEDLNNHPEVLAEAIQTILRREGAEMPYEALKQLTQGKKVTMEAIQTFVRILNVDQSVKEELLKLTPENYIGISKKLVG